MKLILMGLIIVGVVLFVIFYIIIPLFQSTIPNTKNLRDIEELDQETKTTLKQYENTKKIVEETKQKVDIINNKFKN